MADPFSLSTGIVGLVSLALQLVIRTLGMIDKTVTAHQEAAEELRDLLEDLEDLRAQMIRIHGTLEVLGSNTKDRGFKKLLREYVLIRSSTPEGRFNNLSSQHGEGAIAELCTALDETFVALELLTGQSKAEEVKLDSIAPPTDTRSLAFVQAVLKHNLAPSKTTNLLKCLRDMRSEIQKCFKRLDTAFQHVWTLYIAMTNGLERVATNISILSTSTVLTARLKLVGWLKDRQDIWRSSKQRKAATNVSFIIFFRLIISQNLPQVEQTANSTGMMTNIVNVSESEGLNVHNGGRPAMSPDAPDAPQPPEPAIRDIGGRRLFADLVRKAGSLLDPDPDQYNNRVYREGRYRTYPRTPGEEYLNPYLREHEEKFYQARRAGQSRSQISLVIPGSPNNHAHTGSGSSQFLEVPRAFHHSPPIITEPQPSSLLLDNAPPTPRITIT
jgi:hypothetical protein